MTLYGNNCLLDLCWDLSFSLLFEQIESPMMKFFSFSALLKFFAPTKVQGCLTCVLYWLELCFLFIYFFFYLGFLSWIFMNHRTAAEGGGGVSLTPHYHLHLLHRNLDISWAITAESSPLYIPTQKSGIKQIQFLCTLSLLMYTSIPYIDYIFFIFISYLIHML